MEVSFSVERDLSANRIFATICLQGMSWPGHNKIEGMFETEGEEGSVEGKIHGMY